MKADSEPGKERRPAGRCKAQQAKPIDKSAIEEEEEEADCRADTPSPFDGCFICKYRVARRFKG
jgi:hypothetical protein